MLLSLQEKGHRLIKMGHIAVTAAIAVEYPQEEAPKITAVCDHRKSPGAPDGF